LQWRRARDFGNAVTPPHRRSCLQRPISGPGVTAALMPGEVSCGREGRCRLLGPCASTARVRRNPWSRPPPMRAGAHTGPPSEGYSSRYVRFVQST
jgi:hypothetical protein